MTGPRVDPTVSFGNLLLIATLIIGGGVTWGVTQGRVGDSAADVAQVQSDYRLLESRVRVLENTIASQTGQLANINSNLGELRADVKRLLEQGK